MPDWEVAIEKQMASWAFYVGEDGARFLRGFRQAQRSEWAENDPLLRSLEHNVASGLWNADPVYVSEDMMTLLEHAWPDFEPERLSAEDVFIPWGFVYLPRPIAIIDSRGNPVRHRAVSWLPARRDEDGAPATFVTTYSEVDDVRRDEEELNAPSRMQLNGERLNVEGMRRYFGQALVLNYASPMMHGQTIEEMLTTSRERTEASGNEWLPGAVDATTQLLKFLQALWRLLGQRVGVGMQAMPSRSYRRRAERAQYPEKYVTVITLRRPKRPSGEEGPEPREWTHRWLVSGHWRWQPYPSEGVRKQIWISPYIKGPEEAPLVIRGARVFKWAR